MEYLHLVVAVSFSYTRYKEILQTTNIQMRYMNEKPAA